MAGTKLKIDTTPEIERVASSMVAGGHGDGRQCAYDMLFGSIVCVCVCPPVALRKPVNVAFVEGVHAPRDRLGYAH